MTPPPNPADLPGPWPDVLAAYVDGELDAHARAAVERWLADNPTARSCVNAQRLLSPENWRFWRDAAPPCPANWDAVRDDIAARLAVGRLAEPVGVPWEKRLTRVIAVPAYALTACVVLFGGFGFTLFPPHPQQVTERALKARADDPLAGIPILLIANEAEVEVHRVDGAGAGGWLPIGGMPLAGRLTLAAADDVELEEAEDHPAWPMGGPRVRRDPADAPLLFPGANR